MKIVDDVLATFSLVRSGYFLWAMRRCRELEGEIARLKAAPPPQSEPGQFDEAKVREALRQNDTRALDEAYCRTFSGDQGRFVLAHFMATCGVGVRQGPGVPADDRHYFAGRQDAALELMNTAGFDQASAVLATMTDTLEGQTHDRYAAVPRDTDLDDI